MDGMLVVSGGGTVVVEVFPVVVVAQLVTTTVGILVTIASVTGTEGPALESWPGWAVPWFSTCKCLLPLNESFSQDCDPMRFTPCGP